MSADLLRIGLRRDRELVPVTTQGVEGIDALGACSCIGSENSRSRWMDSLTFLIARRFSVLARSASGKNDVRRDDRRFLQAALQITDVPPLPLD